MMWVPFCRFVEFDFCIVDYIIQFLSLHFGMHIFYIFAPQIHTDLCAYHLKLVMLFFEYR